MNSLSFVPRSLVMGLLLLLLAGCNFVIVPPAPVAAPAAATGTVAELAGAFELVQLLVDFPAGTWTPAHTHGGMLLVTVRSGELTVRDEQGAEQIYQAGESFTETPGAFLEIGNAGESLVSVATVALLPAGASLTTVKEGISTDSAPPGPTVLYQHKQAITEPLGQFELLQLISDFAPGAWTPVHMHGGMLVVMVVNGELTVRDEQGTEQVYQAGDSFMELPGAYIEVGNAGESVATVSTAALLPAGEKLTTVKEGLSTDSVPPGPTLLFQGKLAANSVAAP